MTNCSFIHVVYCQDQEELEFLIGLLLDLVQVSHINDNSFWMNDSRRLIVLEEKTRDQ